MSTIYVITTRAQNWRYWKEDQMSEAAIDHNKGSRFRRRRCWEIWSLYLEWGKRPPVTWLEFDAAFSYDRTRGVSIKNWHDGQTAIIHQNGTIQIWLGAQFKAWFEWTPDGKLTVQSLDGLKPYEKGLAALEFKPDEPDFSCNGIETDPGFAPVAIAADEGTRDITDVIREIARGS